MKKISFSEKYGLHQAVLSRDKTMTRRTLNTKEPLYGVGEVVAISQRYKDAGVHSIPEEDDEFGCYNFPAEQTPGWTNKMFVRADLMPHHIRIVNIKRERLQDISDEDCMKEGIHWWTKDESLLKYDLGEGFELFKWQDKPRSPRDAFAVLIDKISGKGTWESNPEVWVYEFERID